IAATKAIRDFLNSDAEEYDPRKYLIPARNAIKNTVQGKMRVFGSSGKA
ncbi:MAG TPA: class II fructose-bisphosphate aldolase, partial [Paenisporosarcina sp.]|nr:class II fructose-bisphosphate aldolase [Paenisporosarcina sp.]